MVRSTIPPLLGRFAIVDPKTGNPTLPFCKIWQDFFQNEAGTNQVAVNAATAADASVPQSRKINTTTPIQGGGDLTLDLNLSHNISGVTAGAYTNANIVVDADGHVTGASNGSSGTGGLWYFSPPAVAGFTLISGDATNPTFTTDADIGSVLKFNSASVTGDIMRAAVETITTPAAAWSYEVRMAGNLIGTNFAGAGVMVRNVANDRNVILAVSNDGTIIIQRRAMAAFGSNASTIKGSDFAGHAIFANTFWKLTYDTTNVIFWSSADGKYWRRLFTEPVATYLLAAPDKIGFGFYSAVAGVTDDFELSVQRRIRSW